jgi:hypothetical protein
MVENPSFAALVKEEVRDFFSANPFLLVSESRLAVLLCRPSHMVRQAVTALEDEGLLERRDEDTLVGLWMAGERSSR